MQARFRPASARRGSMGGVSLVELMIGITLGLIVLAGLATLFANTSASRNELERASRQIENGRFAVDQLSDDIRLAGFYGELDVTTLPAPAALPDPCSTDPNVWAAAIPVAIQAYDTGTSAPACMPADYKAGTDILVVRRAAACQAGVSGCPAVQNNYPYVQSAKCATQLTSLNASYRIGLQGGTIAPTGAFDRQLKDCATNAAQRQYFVRIYYISTNNGQGSNVPTLKRLELNGTGFTTVPLVEGIENINYEYGVDYTGAAGSPDGQPDGFTANPTTYAPPGCATCNALSNWMNVVAVRINLLARNTETTPGFTDSKTYTLGLDAGGNPVTYTPGDGYRRHVYTTVVRVVNVSQRRELP